MYEIDATHDPARQSWVESANVGGTDFPIQNLPFGRFRGLGSQEPWRIGVAIGDQVLDARAAGLIATDDMNALMAASGADRRALRQQLSDGLSAGSRQRAAWEKALAPQAACELGVPCRIGDYTDFYVGIHHATAVGKVFRPDNPLLPNYKWVPIGYHGRASSVVAHGTPIRRPKGQTAGAQQPGFGPAQRLDLELELGFLVGQGNALGAPISIADAEAHLFGVTLFNDWSARDIQAWEYQPLGPFLAKNFGSTISPWIVTMEALAPFRAPFTRPASDPQPLPYLDCAVNRARGHLDVQLEVLLQTPAMRAAGLPPVTISRSNAAQASYWTPAQLVAHHTVGGCNLQPGDLLGSGTLSGPAPEQAGSLLELTAGGKQPITLPNGEQRIFLQDGDTLSLAGYCERAGARRIGFGPCAGTIEASV
ncbi:MAG: fumarylacetoacetase [Burkholderiaceae bacterium]|nr:fumarylacetoacetase [Burkholderiaceae bacterium]